MPHGRAPAKRCNTAVDENGRAMDIAPVKRGIEQNISKYHGYTHEFTFYLIIN